MKRTATSRSFETAARTPGDRGLELGQSAAGMIRAAVDGYARLFAIDGLCDRNDIRSWGDETLATLSDWCPGQAEEVEGIAAGSGCAPEEIAALNARTEILARVSRRRRGECSVLTVLDAKAGRPIAAQTWDWHDELGDCWLVWGFADESGRRVTTLTEAGILGKIGLNSSGVGVLLNVLHHREDGAGPIRVPIHALLRRILAEADNLHDALRLISNAPVSASSAITVVAVEDGQDSAITAEVYPSGPAYVLPDSEGVLVHTNHFIEEPGRHGDLEPFIGPDSLFRYEILRRRSATAPPRDRAGTLAALTSHFGAGGALCCHPDGDSDFGDRYATLATVVIEPAERRMEVLPGGPCGSGGQSSIEANLSNATKEQDDVRTH